MLQTIRIPSDGLMLSGILSIPDQLAATMPGASYPIVVLLHGFGANKEDHVLAITHAFLDKLGYATLRFDMRGCGESEGERAKVLCEDQVRDAHNAVTWLLSNANVDTSRIGIFGHSFGAAIAVYAAATDNRIAACISSAGWGDGASKFREQHASPQAWEKFTSMMEDGRARSRAGESMRVSRFDIVPIPQHMRAGLPPGAFMDFPYEVVESMFRFRPNDVVAQIAPRPLLLLHPSFDSVTPTSQSIELFRHAKMPVDLHLFAGIDHFIFADENTIALNLLSDWLAKNLAGQDKACETHSKKGSGQ
ncbi:alpha/beta hydrolase [Polaromonas jejuensis]|uniref:Alpha/beta hydrolase n=1 Tax=Polaromonas jejuensis TaxID=457502 RepID=A0ABW0Q7S8_9BURK|nr:alpha/beta fold hydrolase [Polaromonas jejuensis]